MDDEAAVRPAGAVYSAAASRSILSMPARAVGSSARARSPNEPYRTPYSWTTSSKSDRLSPKAA